MIDTALKAYFFENPYANQDSLDTIVKTLLDFQQLSLQEVKLAKVLTQHLPMLINLSRHTSTLTSEKKERISERFVIQTLLSLLTRDFAPRLVTPQKIHNLLGSN